VLVDGRIAEAGAHEELVERAGVYASLFETQARHYR
jgi:ATP-binding cassette subfamily B protein